MSKSTLRRDFTHAKHYLNYSSMLFTDGSHPFYLDMRQSGKAHGVYLRNSNGMDVIYGDGYLMYRVIGGLYMHYYTGLGC